MILGCGTLYCTLCFCLGSGEVFELSPLDFPGELSDPCVLLSLSQELKFTIATLRCYIPFVCKLLFFIGAWYSWSSIGSIGTWRMANSCSCVGRSANLHPCRFLLLLCEEVRFIGNLAQINWNQFFATEILFIERSFVFVCW